MCKAQNWTRDISISMFGGPVFTFTHFWALILGCPVPLVPSTLPLNLPWSSRFCNVADTKFTDTPNNMHNLVHAAAKIDAKWAPALQEAPQCSKNWRQGREDLTAQSTTPYLPIPDSGWLEPEFWVNNAHPTYFWALKCLFKCLCGRAHSGRLFAMTHVKLIVNIQTCDKYIFLSINQNYQKALLSHKIHIPWSPDLSLLKIGANYICAMKAMLRGQ